MAEIINLNKVRKDRARAEAKSKASENRTKHGRTKADRALSAARTKKAERDLDQIKRED